MNVQTTILRPKTTLDDKWTVQRGRVLINGTQAIARVLLAQKARDEAAGLNTAGYITGYRGSPLGNVDTTLWSIGKRLAAADIKFVPGVNEDMAATAVRGTQQLDAVPNPLFDGVFGAWYGKGPGVDRSGDALKHGNFAGSHPNGGVVVFYGDDHGGKSSSIAHHSEQAMAAALIPSLYPADPAEILEYGLMAYAMSRYSGSWVGLKLVNEIVEQTMTTDIDVEAVSPFLPEVGELPPEGVHARSGAFGPLREEQIVSDYRLPLVERFVRENAVDRTEFRAETPRLGLVTAGKSYVDTRQALDLLGLDDDRAGALGVSLHKIGCIWPLEPTGIVRFAEGHEVLFFIEEKKSFVEQQAAGVLYNQAERPLIIGKRDETGNPLMPLATQLEPIRIALAIVERLRRLDVRDDALEEAAARLQNLLTPDAPVITMPRRSPYFCSGCPHSRSTRIPDGSVAMGGIGCHTMVAFVRPTETLLPTHMGGEGGNWMGLAPFTGTQHVFQNMGDGTYYHSGLLAIRAAIASGVNITYKILYNDAVAMTGGQPVDGPISIAEIAQQVRHEGVKTIILVSDNPDAHRGNPDLPGDIRIEHRDRLDEVQRELREVQGCSVLLYEQTCAAEKRRRRKRGTFPDPAKRLFISQAVCEGCGDCSVQSTCVSLVPVETDLGTKRRIDQSSCNKDYSCLNGFCPSFVTVLDAEPRKPKGAKLDESLFAALPAAPVLRLEGGSINMLVAGIGGTGVITVAAIVGMAAHLEGRAASLFDMTGLAQKNGAVFSHVRIAAEPGGLHSQKLGRGEADLLLAFDLVAAMADDASATYASGRTRALVNSDVSPTVAFQFDRDASIDTRLLLGRLRRRVGNEAVETIDATALATALLGDTIAANLFMVGVAAQRGLLPVGVEAIERAVQLNGTAVGFNLNAFRLGRLLVADPAAVERLLPARPTPLAQDLASLVERRAEHLFAYQGQTLADGFRRRVAAVAEAEQAVIPGSDELARAVARTYSRVLAYKDEYEVARLLSSNTLMEEIQRTFGDGARLEYNLAPPVLGGEPVNGRPPKRAFATKWMRPLLSVVARGRRLRGTAFDPFGRAAERRNERALIASYETLLDEVQSGLSAANHARAVTLLSAAEQVRGYGPVKEEAMRAYEAALPTLLEGYRNERAIPVAA